MMSLAKMVEVWRGSLVESQHFGVAAVANAQGELVAGWGDSGLVTYPRSALKPVQAIALVESGAYAQRGLSLRHLALACASHRAEPMHCALASDWLNTMGLDQQALLCGPDSPYDEAAAAKAIVDGQPRQRIFNNCSGKHCGFLALSQHHGWPLDSYDDLQHPAQQHYLDALAELSGLDAAGVPFGVDGCALPAAAMSVAAGARMMARFAQARVASPARAAAIRTIQDAMRSHPELISGASQPGVAFVRVTAGRILIKTGAEGFLSACIPAQGLGIALKIADGEARARRLPSRTNGTKPAAGASAPSTRPTGGLPPGA